ncbi:MAG TPA: sensor histidine kinase [Bryobacteraceae bacterium]|nr:sensor histidine kinase [Bryobacteraceae bacterium]
MLPHSWRKFLAIVRLILGVTGIVIQLIAFNFVFSETAVLFAVYTVYAAIELLWRSLEDSRYRLLGLAIDFLFFLVSAATPVAYGNWVSAVFFGYVLIAAAILNNWWATLAVSGGAMSLVYIVAPLHGGILFPALIAAGIVACGLAIEREHLEDRLSHSARQSVLYRYDAEKAREAERQRIAADFHDGPLQSFISFQMRLEIIRKLMSRDKNAAHEELVQLQDICRTQVNDLRAFVRSMRPVDVEGSLNATLRRVVEQFQKDSSIPATFVSNEFLEPAEPEISLELLQIVREALYNVQKHSNATRVAVTVQKVDHALEITVEDNGAGFPFSGKYSLEELEVLRLGPTSIKRRVRTLGAEMLLDSKPGQGAGLMIRLATA